MRFKNTLLTLLFSAAFLSAQESDTVTFTPPTGWRLADSKMLSPNIKAMVIGKGRHEFPPSINMTTEKYNGTIKDYLKIVKEINDNQGSSFKDLGTIQTYAGKASVSQVDYKNQWGEIREMHVMLINDGTVYILTAAALKDEFPSFYKDFFTSMRSLKINKKPIDLITNAEKKQGLNDKISSLKKTFSQLTEGLAPATVFNSESFQKDYWLPFKENLELNFKELGTQWEELFLQDVQNSLLQENQQKS